MIAKKDGTGRPEEGGLYDKPAFGEIVRIFHRIERTPNGLDDVSCLPRLTERLFQLGWTEDQVTAVLGGNFLRVLRHILPDRPVRINN